MLNISVLVMLNRDGPLLVVASGRDTVSVASSIRRLASENVFVVQVCSDFISVCNHVVCFSKEFCANDCSMRNSWSFICVDEYMIYIYIYCLTTTIFLLWLRFENASFYIVFSLSLAQSNFKYYSVFLFLIWPSCQGSYQYFQLSTLQIQHPRKHLSRFDMVITPRHDYYPLTPEAQKQIPQFLRSWITPCEPPEKHVVCVLIVYCLLFCFLCGTFDDDRSISIFRMMKIVFHVIL